ncbi:DnaT-like ssDNA-binding protein [Mesorhizobium sp. BR1-1-13]|uniref:DnaT-like ssDNA-binding protein n=1 Tax=Mesorhizobium sp. BR1-1-13 TaxID=2876656 RepID=UPI0029625A31|nr:DnaT-like ssDNA-binding protein [Mesorhizobium sp. BR1-1-13]
MYRRHLRRARFSGQPTGGINQERAWPRTGATAYGSALASDLIPQRVIDASYEQLTSN